MLFRSVINKVGDQEISGDANSLTEMFVILLDNSIKYSDKNTCITLESKISGKNVVVSIKDEGIGIDKKDIPYIFERFYRADKSRTKSHVKGFGLGLSIAKQIAEKHNGQIKVESAQGKGSTFFVSISQSKT